MKCQSFLRVLSVCAGIAWIRWVLISCLFAFLPAVSSRGRNAGSPKLEQTILLPGVVGRIDHFSADIGGKRLFVAALGNSSVEVLDVERGERISGIKGLKEPQGLLYDSERNRLYVATGGDGKVRIYDGKTLGLESTLDFGDDADNLRMDPESGEVWVGFGNGAIGIIDSSGQKVGTISLGSHPESFQFDEAADRFYVNVPKQLGVAVIDWKKRAVIAKWALGLSFANYPMALDRVNRRLFVGCRLPARLVVIDTTSGQIIKALPTVGDADDVFYDEKRRCIYIVGGEGAIEVIRQQSPDVYEPAGRTVTATGARTGYWWPSSDRLYVAAPGKGGQAAALLVYAVSESAEK
jgi:DNA-binding beta-propeller fold protein YncE